MDQHRPDALDPQRSNERLADVHQSESCRSGPISSISRDI
ncbi:hypothetical protein KPATCC21470_1180 [Kitasatospora purpeofusca]